jgi:pimeloyl-ACP methyl ester carboxylesterase
MISRRRMLAGAASVVAGGALPADARLAATVRRTRNPAHFVLVHGAFHGAWCWYKITAALEASGHRATAIDLPSAGIDPTPAAVIDLQAQAEAVIAVLDALAEPAIVVGHSAGGPVISMVAEARPAKIAKLVYLSAYLLQNGASIVSMLPNDPDSLVLSNIVLTPDGVFVRLDQVREIFYGTSDDADVELARFLLKPIGVLTSGDPVTVGAAFASVRRFYVSCSRDRAITPGFQRALYSALPCEEVFTIRSDHSPFFSRPAALVRILERIART